MFERALADARSSFEAGALESAIRCRGRSPGLPLECRGGAGHQVAGGGAARRTLGARKRRGGHGEVRRQCRTSRAAHAFDAAIAEAEPHWRFSPRTLHSWRWSRRSRRSDKRPRNSAGRKRRTAAPRWSWRRRMNDSMAAIGTTPSRCSCASARRTRPSPPRRKPSGRERRKRETRTGARDARNARAERANAHSVKREARSVKRPKPPQREVAERDREEDE